jgi:hypothetical protein
MTSMYYSKVIEVIETTRMVGKGIVGDPYRRIFEYWTLDGNLLALKDELYGTHALDGRAATSVREGHDGRDEASA